MNMGIYFFVIIMCIVFYWHISKAEKEAKELTTRTINEAFQKYGIKKRRDHDRKIKKRRS